MLNSRSLATKRRAVSAVIAVAAVALAWFGYSQWQDYSLGRRLILASPDSIPSQPELVVWSERAGKNAYA